MFNIDKKYLIAGAAVLAIIMFMLEPLQWGSANFRPSVSASSGQNVTGTAVFDGTIRTYDPILLLPLATNQSVIDQLRLHSGVRNVQMTNSSYEVQVETRDDVYPIASWIRSMNATAYSIANVAVNSEVQVQAASGNITVYVPNGIVRVVAEPILDADSPVTVSMVAVVRDKTLIDYTSAEFALNQVELVAGARVAAIGGVSYSYSIPWAERNTIGNASEWGVAEYGKVDSIVFSPQLNVSQIMAKRQFHYITYIDSGSAQVLPSFDNASEVALNFADTPYVLPPSTLTILANETPPLNYTPDSIRYRYTVEVNSTGYDFGEYRLLPLEGTESYAEGDLLEINVSAVALGNRILSVKRVSLPS
jgi:hypothetical protein